MKLAQDGRTVGSIHSVAWLFQSCSVLVSTLPATSPESPLTLANSFLFPVVMKCGTVGAQYL